jgi:uncharacterized protein
MAESFHRTIFLPGAAGRLEALLWTVEAEPSEVAAVCHPHPLFGGTLHNKVVYHAAKMMHEHGMPVLRFNFRGAGLSEGKHDEGRGEREDVRAAIDYLAETFPGKLILLAGFSFGAWVGLGVGCADERVKRLIGIGLPVNKSDVGYLVNCRKPKLFVQGGNDEFGSPARLRELMKKWPEPKKLVVVEGGDHFFAGKLDQLDEAIRSWL